MLRRSEPPQPFPGVRVEFTTTLAGRPAVIVGWFAPPEPEVGILRPSLVASVSIDQDGIYEAYRPGSRMVEYMRARAEFLLGAQPC